jgi:hypothetical protein
LFEFDIHDFSFSSFLFFVSLFWNSHIIHNLQGRIPNFRKTSLQDFWKHGFLRIFWLSHSVCCNFLGCTCFAWLGHHRLFLSLLFDGC